MPQAGPSSPPLTIFHEEWPLLCALLSHQRRPPVRPACFIPFSPAVFAKCRNIFSPPSPLFGPRVGLFLKNLGRQSACRLPGEATHGASPRFPPTAPGFDLPCGGLLATRLPPAARLPVPLHFRVVLLFGPLAPFAGVGPLWPVFSPPHRLWSSGGDSWPYMGVANCSAKLSDRCFVQSPFFPMKASHSRNAPMVPRWRPPAVRGPWPWLFRPQLFLPPERENCRPISSSLAPVPRPIYLLIGASYSPLFLAVIVPHPPVNEPWSRKKDLWFTPHSNRAATRPLAHCASFSGFPSGGTKTAFRCGRGVQHLWGSADGVPACRPAPPLPEHQIRVRSRPPPPARPGFSSFAPRRPSHQPPPGRPKRPQI